MICVGTLNYTLKCWRTAAFQRCRWKKKSERNDKSNSNSKLFVAFLFWQTQYLQNGEEHDRLLLAVCGANQRISCLERLLLEPTPQLTMWSLSLNSKVPPGLAQWSVKEIKKKFFFQTYTAKFDFLRTFLQLTSYKPCLRGPLGTFKISAAVSNHWWSLAF